MSTLVKIICAVLIFSFIAAPAGIFAHEEMMTGMSDMNHEGMDMDHSDMNGATSTNQIPMSAPTSVTSETSLPLFKYRAHINTNGKAGMFEAVLPTEHTSKMTADDIKIVSTDNEGWQREVPFLLMEGDYVDPFHSMASNLKNTASKNGGIETVIDVSDIGMQHYGIYLEIPEYIFPTQTVAVYGSDMLLPIDSPAWLLNELQNNSIIYSYVDPMTGQQIRNNTVEYKATKQRYLKLIAKPVSKEQSAAMIVAGLKPFKIAGGLIQAVPSRYTVRDVRVIDIIPKNVRITPKPEEKKTEINIDIGSENIYSHGFDIATSSEKFIYWYLVESSLDNVTWKPEAEGNIFNISDKTFADSDMRIKYPEIRARYIRVSIYDNGTLVDEVSKDIVLKSNVRSLIFEAEARTIYDVYIGNTAVQPAIYDTALLKKYGIASTTEISVGKLKKNTPYSKNMLWFLGFLVLVSIITHSLYRRRLRSR